MGRQRSGKRTWLAVALALLYPGAGHLYLREGLRALLWFGLVFATTLLSIPTSAIPDSGELSIETITAASQALPTAASVAIVVLSVLSTIDAYRLARQRNGRVDAATTPADEPDTGGDCPHCGREADTEFEFCQWCGEPLDAAGS
ncbi:zinc ribbon domain-containing protein [Halococcus agarilyticus]|uniref:zinc ribbon domain-containing protein n=1 Tax=Halococcus agarilyticus TaxID=1232219 RepID=UPI000677ED10|nr:zinc ribbon domain-containing protein [Halococcus agarilyticus]